MAHSSRFLISVFLAEMLGTFFLVFIGDGAIASFVVKRQAVDLFAVCLNFGIGAMIATFISGKISGGHINPAGTLAAACAGDFQWALVPIYMVAQYLGGFLAALALYINYAEGISDLDGGLRSAFGEAARSSGGIFATYPGPFVSVWGALLDQTLGTFIFFFALSAISDTKNLGLEKRHQPIAISLAVCGICMAFLPNCGAIFNPARDVAPRLLTLLVGYSDPSPFSPLNGAYWLTAGLVGPHLGAIIGVFGYKYAINYWLVSSPINQYDLDMIDEEQQQHEHKSPLRNQPGQHNNQQQAQHQHHTTQFSSKGYPESISYGSTMQPGGRL